MLIHEKYIFTKEKTFRDRSYWRCKAKSECKARVISVDGKLERFINEHNHPPNSNEILRRKFRTRVKERVRQMGSLLTMPTIFNEEKDKMVTEIAKITSDVNDPSFVLPTYRNIRKTLYNERLRSRTSLTPQEIENDDMNLGIDERLLPSKPTELANGKVKSKTPSSSSSLRSKYKDSTSHAANSSKTNYLSSPFEEDDSMNIDDPCDPLKFLLELAEKSSGSSEAKSNKRRKTTSQAKPFTSFESTAKTRLRSKSSACSTRKGLLDRLKDNVVVGDGGFVFALEKRGYVKAGPWTPEATVEHPDAVRNLHREFLRAGSDVMQAFTFYASEDKLMNRGNEAGKLYTGNDINNAACKIAREVADEGDALVAGGISQTPSYLSNKGKAAVQAEFRKQVQVFVSNQVDFLICEYFEHIEEMEWAIEVCKETSLPVAASMCIGFEGDLHDVPAGECAVRMAKAGADVVGVNCHFDPFKSLETIAMMKKALEAQNLKPYLMTQPLGFHAPDAGKQGFIDLPEFPFALEPRVCTRWDMMRYAREAYELGVRYIGGCCGFESYHIRAVSEELAKERGKMPESSKKHEPWGEGLKMHTKPWVRARARKEYWQNINPSTGRPLSAAFSKPDNWGVTAGSEDLKQKEESTTNEELQKVFAWGSK